MSVFNDYFKNFDKIHYDFCKQVDDYLEEQLRPYGIAKENIEKEKDRVRINMFGTVNPFVKVYDVFIDNDYKFSIRVSEHFFDTKNSKPVVDFERFISKSF